MGEGLRSGVLADREDIAVDILATLGQMEMLLRCDIHDQRGYVTPPPFV